MKRSLEERVTEGRLTYVEHILFLSQEARCTIRFIDYPETVGPPRELTFAGIRRFSEEHSFPEDYDPEVVDNLIGLDEHETEHGPERKYVIVTTEREIIITTTEEPTLTIINE